MSFIAFLTLASMLMGSTDRQLTGAHQKLQLDMFWARRLALRPRNCHGTTAWPE
jgi:hypothetical protein